MNSWVNGRGGHTVDCRDRGLHYGDGLFETMRVQRRSIRLLDYHLDRLLDGCRRLGLRLPDRKRLRNELQRIAAGRSEGVLKLIVTRGIGPRGYRPITNARSTRVISLHPLPRKTIPASGEARVRLCTIRLGVNETLAGLKTLNRLESVLARAEWADPRVWEGLMRDTDGHIVCGTMSNLFVRRGSSLITPMLDRCGVAGVMRRWVLEQASTLKLTATIARLRWQDVCEAEEAFMTNAIVGVVPLAVIHHGRIRHRLAQRHTANELRRRLQRQ